MHRLIFLHLSAPVENREEEGYDCGAEPEPGYVSEIVYHCAACGLYHIHPVQQEAGHYILYACSGV